VNLEHDESGQRDEQGEDDEQQRPLHGANAPDCRTASGYVSGLRNRRPPLPENDIQQAAGDGDKEQTLGDFDPPLQNRIIDAHVQQGTGDGDPERGEDSIEQRNADGRQSPFLALWIALRVNWLRHQVLAPVYDMLFGLRLHCIIRWRGPEKGRRAAVFLGKRAETYKPRLSHNISTRCFTAASMTIGVPHSRLVSPGHLFVASIPILLPRPATGEAKSR